MPRRQDDVDTGAYGSPCRCAGWLGSWKERRGRSRRAAAKHGRQGGHRAHRRDPVAALLASVVVLWGNGIHLRDVVIAVALYALTGHGVTIGFHRLLAHKAFTANRPLKLVLVTLGDDSAADTVRSLSPAMTTTGTLISLRRPERSTPSNRRVNPRRCTEGLANPTWRTLTTWLRRALRPKFPLVSTTP